MMVQNGEFTKVESITNHQQNKSKKRIYSWILDAPSAEQWSFHPPESWLVL